MSVINKLNNLSLEWNYAGIAKSLEFKDPLLLDDESETDCISLSIEQAKWLSEELNSILQKIDRYKLYIELKEEFENK